MSLTNICKFGLKHESIVNREYKYIIGLDAGDGEVTASYIRLDAPAPEVKDVKLGRTGDGTKLLSGIYIYHDPALEPVVGSMEQLSKYSEDRGRLYINFKVNPHRLLEEHELFEGTDITKKSIVSRFIAKVIEAVKTLNPDHDFSGKGILAVGCPSSPEWLGNGRDLAYARFISEAVGESGLDLTVVVMPESRASWFKVYKEAYTDEVRERMLKGVIVLDSGSSTFDVTYIDFDTNTQVDRSIPLGASMIEKTILRKAVSDAGYRMPQLARPLQTRLDARGVKEAYFTEPTMAPRLMFEFSDDNLAVTKCNTQFMEAVIGSEQVRYSTETSPQVSGTWSELHRRFLEDCRSSMVETSQRGGFKGLVILTGGASQMQFLQQTTREVFPQAMHIVDQKASYCVSRGLSHAMHADLLAYILIDEVKKKIAAEILSSMEGLKADMAKQVAPVVYEFVRERTKAWAEQDKDMTLGEFSKQVRDDFKSDATDSDKERLARVRKACVDALMTFLNADGDNGLRKKIVRIVNDTFKQYFPGTLRYEHIAGFRITDKDWEAVVKDAAVFDYSSIDNIVSNIDVESGLAVFIKGVAVLLMVVPFLAINFLIAIFSDSTAEKFAKKIDQALTKTFYKSDRQKAYEKCVAEKDTLIEETAKNLSKNILKDDSQKDLAAAVTSAVGPLIDKAVDNVSLYF